MLMSEILNKPMPEYPALLGGRSIFPVQSYVGVEIELENVSRDLVQGLRNWNVVAEGSVSGWELVLKEPMSCDQLYLAINELKSIAGDINEEETFTERTSNHVHIDIRDMTYTQFMNFLTLSVMFEPVMYKYVAPHRSSNHFCWSFLDSEGLITRLNTVSRRVREDGELAARMAFRDQFSQGSTKYSGINLSSVSQYGSLEFRMHEGTINGNAIIRWINILLSIKEYAMGDERTPQNILETKQSVGIDSIFTAVLGRYRGILSYDGVSADILKGIRQAQDFVYEVNVGSPINYARALPQGSNSPYINFLTSLNDEHLRSSGTREINNATN